MRAVALVLAVSGVAGCHGPAAEKPAAAPVLGGSAKCPAAPADLEGAPDEDQINRLYEGLREAVNQGASCAFPAFVDSETLRVYEVLRQWALTAPRARVEGQPIVERTLVLEMRARFGTQLREMTGADVLAAGLDPPPHALETLVALRKLSDLRVDEYVAFAMPVYLGTDRKFRFVKEEGRWGFDLITAARDLSPLFEQLAGVTGDSTEDFIARYIEARTGVVVDDSIWQPIGE